MTTEQLRAIAEAAKARQADITPAPWQLVSDAYANCMEGGHTDILDVRGCAIGFENTPDAQLITAAPDLNAAVVELWERLQAAQGVDAWEVD